MIWADFAPSPRYQEGDDSEDSDDEDNGPGSLGILRTCHRLHEEILPHIYEKEVLRIEVDDAYGGLLCIIHSRQGRIWTLSPFEDDSLLGIEDGLYKAFRNLPYKRLRGIKIEIAAPNHRDPGLIICLWERVKELVDLLSAAKGLPNIDIHLQNTLSTNWSYDSKPRNTIIGLSKHSDDYKAMLLLFCRLRNIRKAKIHVSLPKDLIQEGPILADLEATMELKEPFGSASEEPYLADQKIQQHLDALYVHFDKALDMLPGRTARMLRLRRFRSWFSPGRSKYVEEWERISSDRNQTLNFADLEWRHDLMLAFNPMSAKNQLMRWYDRMSLKPIPEYKTEWSIMAWNKYYPKGIRPLHRSAELIQFLKEMKEENPDKIWNSFRERHLKRP